MAHNRLVIAGTLGTAGVERWSCGLTYGVAGNDLVTTPEDLNEWCANVATYLASLGTTHTLRAWLSASANISKVSAYYYSGTGPAVAVGEKEVTPALTGSGAISMPFQCSRVITLNTALAGRRYRGRVYWPYLFGTVSAAGKTSSSQNSIDEVKASLVAIGAAAPTVSGLDLAVRSEAANAVTPVTSISVGDVIDTQRRRRDALVETRLVSVI